MLRERAEAATLGPWEASGQDIERYFSHIGEWGTVATAEDRSAAYIATMHPGVGLALADWLESTTCGFHCGDDGMRFPYCSMCEDSTFDHECPSRRACEHTEPMRHALRLADLILGSAS